MAAYSSAADRISNGSGVFFQASVATGTQMAAKAASIDSFS